MEKERSRCQFETNGSGQGKLIFATAGDADSFERYNRQLLKWERQYVYRCPHADHFHLTTKQQEISPVFAKVNLVDLAKFKHVRCVNSSEENKEVQNNGERRTRRTYSLEQKAEIVLKVVEGSTRASVCSQYDIDHSLLSYWMNSSPIVMTRVNQMVEKKKHSSTTTVAECESEEQRLERELEAARSKFERELEAVRTKKLAIIEAKRPKIVRYGDRIIVTKEGNTLAFAREDFEGFVAQLTEFMTGPTSAAAKAGA